MSPRWAPPLAAEVESEGPEWLAPCRECCANHERHQSANDICKTGPPGPVTPLRAVSVAQC